MPAIFIVAATCNYAPSFDIARIVFSLCTYSIPSMWSDCSSLMHSSTVYCSNFLLDVFIFFSLISIEWFSRAASKTESNSHVCRTFVSTWCYIYIDDIYIQLCFLSSYITSCLYV